MLGLVPTEYWEYKFSDFIRGFCAVINPEKLSGLLYIDGVGNCIPARSGRAALITAIRALDLPSGACIGVPLYCCPIVFKAIKATGCTVRFIDVDPDSLCISADDLAAKISQINAVIAVHMFGNVCDMPRLREVAQEKPVIEDCAQSLGSTLGGRMTGLFGDIAFFSFRSGKYLSVGEGGALYSSNEKIFSKINRLISALPVPSRMEDYAHVIKTYIRSLLRSKPLWGLVGHRLWSIYNKSTDFSEKTPIVLSQMFGSDIAITTDRLPILNSLIKKQRAIADYYSTSLSLGACAICNERLGAFYNRYLYPIIFPTTADRDSIAMYLLQRMIDTIQPYKDISEIAAAYYEYKGDCPIAEQVAKRVLVLPSYSSLEKTELQRIVQCINKAWVEVGYQICTTPS